MSGKLICGNCLKVLPTLPKVKAIFVDPPDNINYSYKDQKGNVVYQDKMGLDEYYTFLASLLWSSYKADIFWFSFNQKHDLRVKSIIHGIVKQHPEWQYQQIIWRYTFGQYKKNSISSGYRPIICLVKDGTKLNLDAVREESARMRLGDKRAAGPRIPDDVWDFSRVVGNAKERRSWHSTQHPEALMERIIKLSCGPKDIFVDLCMGSGTSAIVCEKLGISWIGIEQSSFYCDKIAQAMGINYERNGNT